MTLYHMCSYFDIYRTLSDINKLGDRDVHNVISKMGFSIGILKKLTCAISFSCVMFRGIAQFVQNHLGAFLAGFISSFIASGIFWFVLLRRRPQIEIFPRIVKNIIGDQMHYVIFYHSMRCLCRKTAIDLKVTATLYGKAADQSYTLEIPLHTNEFPIFEAIEPWDKGKRERSEQIPIMLDSQEFFKDVFNQVKLMGKLNSDLNNELSELLSLNPNQWSKIPWSMFAKCFEKLFPHIYEKIEVSINYQDASSGIRNTKTIYINALIEEDITKYKNWRRMSKKLNRR